MTSKSSAAAKTTTTKRRKARNARNAEEGNDMAQNAEATIVDETAAADATDVPASTSTALAANTNNGHLAVLTGNEEMDEMLALFGGESGMEDMDDSDFARRYPRWMVNCPVRIPEGKPDAGKRAPKENWTNTGDPTQSVEHLEVILLQLRKTNHSAVYDRAEQRNQTLCVSIDQTTGHMPEGVTRQCDGCPDKEWGDKSLPDDQRKPKCNEEWQLLAVHASDPMGDFIRISFARDDIPKILKPYLQANHAIRRAGKLIKIPLPAYVVRLGSREKGEGYGPTMECLAPTMVDTIKALASRSEESRETLTEILQTFLDFEARKQERDQQRSDEPPADDGDDF